MTQVTRLFDFYYQQDKYTSIPDALNTKNGVWIKTSTQEYIEQANAISRALLRMESKK
jgi:long-chain acyl-CoA synthetase